MMNQNLNEFITQTPVLLMALIAGIFFAIIFFGGLWWTVKKMQIARQPALLFFASFLTRTAIVVYGFYWISDGQWQRLASCMLGFLLGRFAVIRITDSIAKHIAINDVSATQHTQNDLKENSHAS